MIPAAEARIRATPARAVRAEWLKFATLVSTPLTAVAAALMIVGFAALLVWARGTESVTPTTPELLTGASWAQMVIAVLAAVFACSEWSSGTKHVTFLSVPTRWPVVWGKAIVVGSVAGAVGASGAALALVAGAVGGMDIAADTPLASRLVAGAGVYLAGIAILAVGIGVIVRNLVASVLSVIAFVWVLPLAISLIPWEMLQRVVPYLPSPAGGLLIAAENPAAELTPWGGGAVLLAWALVGLVAATVALRRRDV